MEKSKIPWNLILALGTGLLLWLAWPPISLTILVFLGFVPLLFLVENLITTDPKNFRKYAGWVYLSLLAWNTFTTYWVCIATLGGGLMALLANSFLMSIPFWVYRYVRVKCGWKMGIAQLVLVSFWLSLELLHLNWQLAWPWLNLGNVFASRPDWVQWYEYTGAFGGSLWVWVVNLLIFNALWEALQDNSFLKNKQVRYTLISGLIILILPVFISQGIAIPKNPDYKVNTVVLQPNINPYTEKFDKSEHDEQIRNFFKASSSKIDSTTELLIWPETVIPGSFQEGSFYQSKIGEKIDSFLARHPQITLIAGLNSYEIYQTKATPTARSANNGDYYYDVFNSAIATNSKNNTQFYNKSILVPGVEKMPYPGVLGFLGNLAIEMGGTSGSLGSQKEPSVFKINDSLKVAPIICYESVFGDYVGDFIRKGADIIAVITNDGWWGNTAGYKQHFQYSVLRAIEMRKSIARSANTGISGFITPNGQVYEKTAYWVEDVRSMALPVYNNGMTFYAIYGDLIGYLAFMISGLIVIAIIFRRFFMKKGEVS